MALFYFSILIHSIIICFSVPSVANLIFNNQSYLTNNQLTCRPLRSSIELMPIFCMSRAIVLPTPGICSNSCKLDDSIERCLRYYSPITNHAVLWSMKPSSLRDRTGCCSFLIAFASTCLTRSRVTLKILPTSSSV